MFFLFYFVIPFGNRKSIGAGGIPSYSKNNFVDRFKVLTIYRPFDRRFQLDFNPFLTGADYTRRQKKSSHVVLRQTVNRLAIGKVLNIIIDLFSRS